MASLQDQFLKAGLVDKNKAKQANHEKNKQKKVELKTGTQTVSEARLAAQELQRKNAEISAHELALTEANARLSSHAADLFQAASFGQR